MAELRPGPDAAAGPEIRSIAHELANVLTAFSGNAELVLDALDRDDPIRADVEEIRRAAERLTVLVRRLQALSGDVAVAPAMAGAPGEAAATGGGSER